MGVSQQVIAKKLGICRTTVSRCFTNHNATNPETRAAVFALAAELGYNYMEKRTGEEDAKVAKSKTLAVLICSHKEEYEREDYESPGMQFLAGISEYALLHKIDLDINFVNPDEKSLKSKGYGQLLKKKKSTWDGILFVYPFPSKIILGLSRQFPCVSLVEQFGAPNIDGIAADHHRGIAHLMQILIDLGHRRIGFFSRQYPVPAPWAFRRYGAYVEKLAREGIPCHFDDIINVYASESMDLNASYAKAIQQTRDGVTAWVCPADHIAYDLMHKLQSAGLKLKEDFSITGFDGLSAPVDSVALTTMQMPYRRIGYQATKRLSDLLTNRYAMGQHTNMMCKLIAGNTVFEPSKNL
jgi:DNA-binding LacI/PurR family transcriptional regulator